MLITIVYIDTRDYCEVIQETAKMRLKYSGDMRVHDLCNKNQVFYVEK